jgi:transcriptional regulator with XRE-family HTH domain
VGETQRRIGARVREFRHVRRLTQAALSERAGLSCKFIGEVERGVGNPTVESLDAIARALGLSVDDLFARDRGTYATLAADDFALVREARDTLEGMLKRHATEPTPAAVSAPAARRTRKRATSR